MGETYLYILYNQQNT